MIKLDFSFPSPYGTFSDAIYLPDDHAMTDADIEKMKQQRLKNWIAIIEAPVEAPQE